MKLLLFKRLSQVPKVPNILLGHTVNDLSWRRGFWNLINRSAEGKMLMMEKNKPENASRALINWFSELNLALKPFLLLWQNSKWQEISICKCENFLTFKRANSMETNLRTCNLQTSQFISYKFEKQLRLILPHQMSKKNHIYKWITLGPSKLENVADPGSGPRGPLPKIGVHYLNLNGAV